MRPARKTGGTPTVAQAASECQPIGASRHRFSATAGRTFRARASVTEGSERQRLWDQHVAQRPEFAEYPEKTDRVIPIILLEPMAAGPEAAARETSAA